MVHLCGLVIYLPRHVQRAQIIPGLVAVAAPHDAATPYCVRKPSDSEHLNKLMQWLLKPFHYHNVYANTPGMLPCLCRANGWNRLNEAFQQLLVNVQVATFDITLCLSWPATVCFAYRAGER